MFILNFIFAQNDSLFFTCATPRAEAWRENVNNLIGLMTTDFHASTLFLIAYFGEGDFNSRV